MMDCAILNILKLPFALWLAQSRSEVPKPLSIEKRSPLQQGAFLMSNQGNLVLCRALYSGGQGTCDILSCSRDKIAIEVVVTFSSFRFPELSQPI
jgi:hypothetical protein